MGFSCLEGKRTRALISGVLFNHEEREGHEGHCLKGVPFHAIFEFVDMKVENQSGPDS